MIELRDYQNDAVQSLFSYWESNTGNPIISAATGSGKSIMIAAFIKEACRLFPSTRIIVLSHVMEILTQDFEKLHKLWPDAPMGVYSAGLGKRQLDAQILFASIQSIYKKGLQTRKTDLILIDECHLLSPKDQTRYRKFISDIKMLNPHLKCGGFSATPYRLDSGWLHKGEGALFTDICCDINVLDLIKKGFLIEPVSKASKIEIDLSDIHVRGGEYIAAEMEAAMDKDEITKASVKEIIEFGKDRNLWLIFSSGLKHSEHICEEIKSYGFSCATISGNTPKEERISLIDRAKRGDIKCLVNYAVLTTGVDLPSIDLIALMRKTKSTSLYQQMIGRGLRTHEGKRNCVILDFCDNITYHGCIDNVIVRDKTSSEPGEMPAKKCPSCKSVMPAGCRECRDCGHVFPPPDPVIASKAKKAPLLTTQEGYEPPLSETPQWFNVIKTTYQIHNKIGSPSSLMVTYKIHHNSVSEWICLGHSGFAKEKANAWWESRHGQKPFPASAMEAMQRILEIGGIKTRRIKAKKDGQYSRIVSYDLASTDIPIVFNGGNMGSIATHEESHAPTV